MHIDLPDKIPSRIVAAAIFRGQKAHFAQFTAPERDAAQEKTPRVAPLDYLVNREIEDQLRLGSHGIAALQVSRGIGTGQDAHIFIIQRAAPLVVSFQSWGEQQLDAYAQAVIDAVSSKSMPRSCPLPLSITGSCSNFDIV